MDFRPKSVFFGKHPDGTKYRIEQWDYDTLAGFELLSIFSSLASGVFILVITAPVYAAITVRYFCGRINPMSIAGAIAGSYVLYDAYNGWILSAFMNIFCNEIIMNIFIILNVLGVVVNLWLILLGTLTHSIIVKMFDDELNRIRTFILLIIGLAFLTITITTNKLNDNKGWFQGNLDRNLNEIRGEQEAIDNAAHQLELKRMEDESKDGYDYSD